MTRARYGRGSRREQCKYFASSSPPFIPGIQLLGFFSVLVVKTITGILSVPTSILERIIMVR
jgi:hypothetical protein